MAAYTAQDLSLTLRGRPAEVEQTWKTLLPLCASYARCTKDFQHLDGLRSYLSATIASAICMHVAMRFTRAANTHDSPQDSVLKTGGDGRDSYNFALLADHTLKSHQHFTDARVALPLQDIQQTYKQTYASREKDNKLAAVPEKITGSRMSGPYFLPLGIDTSPIQAVRFGLRFLGEYCEREGLGWKCRVNLEGVE
jgi:hypothetical protein